MTRFYFGGTGAGKTYQLKKSVSDYLSQKEDQIVYVIGLAGDGWENISGVDFTEIPPSYDKNKDGKELANKLGVLQEKKNVMIVIDDLDVLLKKDDILEKISNLHHKARINNNTIVISAQSVSLVTGVPETCRMITTANEIMAAGYMDHEDRNLLTIMTGRSIPYQDVKEHIFTAVTDCPYIIMQQED